MATPQHIRERRERERRRRRRRRFAAFGALAVLAALVVAVIAGAFGGGERTRSTAVHATGHRAPVSTSVTARPVHAGAAVRATGSYRGPVPILMYHVITAPRGDTAYPELWTPRRALRGDDGACSRAWVTAA